MKLRTRIPSRARASLLALPEEVVVLILKCLTANELMHLRMVSRQHLSLLFKNARYLTCFLQNIHIYMTVEKCSFTDAAPAFDR